MSEIRFGPGRLFFGDRFVGMIRDFHLIVNGERYLGQDTFDLLTRTWAKRNGVPALELAPLPAHIWTASEDLLEKALSGRPEKP